MARDPHEAVDFAPAWLNFNNSNKKKPEKTSRTPSSSASTYFSLNSPLKPSSQDSTFRLHSSGFRPGGSPSRSINTSHWNHHSPSTRSISRHVSADFTPTYLENRNEHFNQNPSRDQKGHLRPTGFSPTFSSAKSSSHMTWLAKNGPTPLHRKSGSGDSGSGLDAEFPSLSDADYSEQNKNKTYQKQSSGTVVNMWQKPLVLKNKESDRSRSPEDSTKSSLSSSIYKTLVPKASHQKQPYRRTMSVPLIFPSKNANSTGELNVGGRKRENMPIVHPKQSSTGKMLTGNTSSLRLAKSEWQNSLNAGLGSGKEQKKGKHEFLNTLRQTDDAGENFEDDKVERLSLDDEMSHGSEVDDWFHADTNGEIEICPKNEKTPLEKTLLSSSLEAEHRLLREMGWKYSDDEAMEEEPPLTEDEIREFQTRFNGVVPTVPVQPEKVLQNAFSGWKFSGRRNRSVDTDLENSVGSSIIKEEDNGCHNDEAEDFSSDNNES